jgi:DNA-directed RNA polymerase subunit beta'
MSVTTIGQLLIEQTLPDDMKTTGTLNKKGVSTLLGKLAQQHAPRYGSVVKNLRDVGNQIAYESGTSFKLEDLRPMTELRDAAVEAHGKELAALHAQLAKNPALSFDPHFQQKQVALHARIEEKVNQAVAQRIEKAPNNLTGWVASGARGDTAMARQMVGMAGMNLDATNRLLPHVAWRSFSEGLSPVDFHVHAQGARRGLVNTYNSVRDPGAFAKELNTIQVDMTITGTDCHTTRGRSLPADSPDLMGRYLAQDVPGVAGRNELVTPRVAQALKAKGGTVVVRSPLYCQETSGVCAHCHGPNEEGKLPQLGDAVGLKSSQALTEPLTQLALNQKHTGGVVGAGKSPLHAILQLMHAPKIFVGAATVAKRSGTIDAVAEAPAGGFHVTVSGTKHYVPPDLTVKVKVGQTIARGDALSTGPLNPVDVVQHKGMEQGRMYFADALRGLYADSGITGHPRVFETVTRGILNLGQVVHPGRSTYSPGEVVHWNKVQNDLSAEPERVGLAQATGRILMHEAGPLAPYTTLTPAHVAQLKGHGLTTVPVFKRDALVVQPLMLGTERAALHKGDWLSNLAFRFVTSTFKENAATGATATIANSFNPLGPYVTGSIGRGTGGRY